MEPRVASFNLVPGLVPRDWRVIGRVENQGKTGVHSLKLRVALLDAANQELAAATIRPLLSNLAPGEHSPFSVNFESVGEAVAAEIELLDYELMEFQRAELEVRLEEFFDLESGELALFGSITNPETQSVVLSEIGFLAEGPGNLSLFLAPMAYGPHTLAPKETVSFIALAPEDPGLARWSSYHDGSIEFQPPLVALELVGPPHLEFTPQGLPFVVGTLVNRGRAPEQGGVLLFLHEGERLVSMLNIQTPLPLDVQEQLPFAAFGFPGFELRRRSDDPEAFRVEARVESQLAELGQIQVLLPVDVSAFHSVGSVLFIRGSVHNPLDESLRSAAVFAEVRSVTGELLTAGWSSAEGLVPGESQAFVVELPLPEGVDATLSEYDLRAIGLQARP